MRCCFQHLSYISVRNTRQTQFYYSINNSILYRGFTALHYAALKENSEIIELLLNYGADPTLEDETAQRAIHFSEEQSIKTYLEEKSIKFEEIKKERDLIKRRQFPLEERLKKHIVGQKSAITHVGASMFFKVS